MTTRTAVDDFLAQRKLAVVGVSRSGKGFGNHVWQALRQKGYDAVAVNPHTDSIGGIPCCHRIADLPRDTGGVVIVVPPAETEAVVRDCYVAGIRRVWMQQGAQSPAAVLFCEENGIQFVSNECILMFAQPEGIHKFHGWLWNILGKAPA